MEHKHSIHFQKRANYSSAFNYPNLIGASLIHLNQFNQSYLFLLVIGSGIFRANGTRKWVGQTLKWLYTVDSITNLWKYPVLNLMYGTQNKDGIVFNFNNRNSSQLKHVTLVTSISWCDVCHSPKIVERVQFLYYQCQKKHSPSPKGQRYLQL